MELRSKNENNFALFSSNAGSYQTVPPALDPHGERTIAQNPPATSKAATLVDEFRNQATVSSHVKMESMLPSHLFRYDKGIRAQTNHLHTVIFAVKKLNMDVLQSMLDDISNPFSVNYGNHLSRAEVSKLTSNVEGSQKLLRFLENHHHRLRNDGRVEVLQMTPNKDYITARASVAQWESFFNTEFYLFHRKENVGQENKIEEGWHFYCNSLER